MSHVFQHIYCSLERDVVLKDLWKNLRTWHNGVTSVPWYNLYIIINNIFPSEKGNILRRTLQFSYFIFHFHFVGGELRVRSPSVHVPQITSTLTPFTLSIFSLSSYASSSLSCVMSEKYQGMRRSEIRQDSLGDEDFNYCHRCHTKTALHCFSTLWVSVNVSACHNL